jgi:hypothetical protein
MTKHPRAAAPKERNCPAKSNRRLESIEAPVQQTPEARRQTATAGKLETHRRQVPEPKRTDSRPSRLAPP